MKRDTVFHVSHICQFADWACSDNTTLALQKSYAKWRENFPSGISLRKIGGQMRKRSIIKCALLSFLAAAALYSDEDRDAVENIIRRAYTSIDRIEEGKIFLKPEKLSLKQGRIYVEDIDGEEFAIPVVFSAVGARPFAEVDDSVIFNMWLCECGQWNHKWDNPKRCFKCHRPR